MLPRAIAFLMLLLLGAPAFPQTSAPKATFEVRISDFKSGSMASEQRCLLVFADRKYHFESAAHRGGRDLRRDVYEGELSQADWDQLSNVLDTKELRELSSPPSAATVIVENLDALTLTVKRGPDAYQNLEFLTKRSRDPYRAALKPALEWWKGFLRKRLTPSGAPPSPYCSLDNNSGQIIAPGM